MLNRVAGLALTALCILLIATAEGSAPVTKAADAPVIVDFNRSSTGIEAIANHLDDSQDGKVIISQNIREENLEPQPMEADHSDACGAPPATHTVSTFEQASFLCGSGDNSHWMTAVNGDGGYALTSLTIPAELDWSAGTAMVRFDVSTARTCQRDWWDVWITPAGEVVGDPVDFLVSNQLFAPHSIQIKMLTGSQGTFFGASIHNGAVHDFANDGLYNYDGESMGYMEERGYETFLTPDRARRDTFELSISPDGRLSFGMPDYGFKWFDALPVMAANPPIPFTSGVVQLVHHSYTPGKCEEEGWPAELSRPNTYHWDNIELSSATPFEVIEADRRYVDWPTRNIPLIFDAPAPAGSVLHFEGRARIEISYDGGASWLLLTDTGPAPQYHQRIYDYSHWASYHVPLPTGQQSVMFRFSDLGWYSGDAMVRDFSIWSLEGGTPSTPTSTPTAIPSPTDIPMPTATSTSVPPATFTPTATWTAGPPSPTATVTTPIATPTSTPTVAPSPTPTPPPASTPITGSPCVTSGEAGTWQPWLSGGWVCVWDGAP